MLETWNKLEKESHADNQSLNELLDLPPFKIYIVHLELGVWKKYEFFEPALIADLLCKLFYMNKKINSDFHSQFKNSKILSDCNSELSDPSKHLISIGT